MLNVRFSVNIGAYFSEWTTMHILARHKLLVGYFILGRFQEKQPTDTSRLWQTKLLKSTANLKLCNAKWVQNRDNLKSNKWLLSQTINEIRQITKTLTKLNKIIYTQ